MAQPDPAGHARNQPSLARLSVPDPVPVVDGLIAATALEHDLTLLTRNLTDVARTSVSHVNPFAR